jgi:hypothetical protein
MAGSTDMFGIHILHCTKRKRSILEIGCTVVETPFGYLDWSATAFRYRFKRGFGRPGHSTYGFTARSPTFGKIAGREAIWFAFVPMTITGMWS